MNTTRHLVPKAGLLTALIGLAGCSTTYRTEYVAPPPPPPVYEPAPMMPAPEPTVVMIRTESDFYEPLSPHGDWVVVAGYGRCWRPARVEAGWRPYTHGHWQRSDAGWYWMSDEPWAWATYHYGRWDWTASFGWIWVPRTQWAPAWVVWRAGGGYVGWAPMPPSARIAASGTVAFEERHFAPRSYVFVEERRMLEPVRPTTVVVNNTTIVNHTVNITKIHVVNHTVINEGPRPDVVERASGHRVQPVSVRDLRHKDETEYVNRRRPERREQEKRDHAAPPMQAGPGKGVPAHQTAPAPQRPQPALEPVVAKPPVIAHDPAGGPTHVSTEPRKPHEPGPVAPPSNRPPQTGSNPGNLIAERQQPPPPAVAQSVEPRRPVTELNPGSSHAAPPAEVSTAPKPSAPPASVRQPDKPRLAPRETPAERKARFEQAQKTESSAAPAKNSPTTTITAENSRPAPARKPVLRPAQSAQAEAKANPPSSNNARPKEQQQKKNKKGQQALESENPPPAAPAP